jgi:hypothetical protein
MAVAQGIRLDSSVRIGVLEPLGHFQSYWQSEFVIDDCYKTIGSGQNHCI